MVKWLPKTASRYSVDAFELQLQEVGEDDRASVVSDFAGVQAAPAFTLSVTSVMRAVSG